MADIRGKDLQPRGSYERSGKSRIDGEQNPEYFRDYYQKNKEQILARNKAARQRRKEAGIKPRVTVQTWRSMVISLLQERDGDHCSICEKKLNFTNLVDIQIDHKVPYWFSQDDSAANLQLAHNICNMRKSRRHGH